MTDWQATHAVPAGGLPVWAEPDPSQPMLADLAQGTEMVLGEQRGGWVEITCSNGFRGWADAARPVALAPAGPPAAGPVAAAGPPVAAKKMTPGGVVVAFVAVIAIVAVIAFVKAGGGDDDDTSTSASSTSAKTIAMHAPSGWSSSSDGHAVAKNQTDLTSESPSGPVARAEVLQPTGDPVDELVAALEDDSETVIVDDPAATTVDGQEAVTVTIGRSGIEQRLIYVHPKGGDPILFTLTAPIDEFGADEADLMSAVGLSG
jgi:hypothetical protein